MSEISPLRIEFKRSPVYVANKKAFAEGWPVICNEGGSRSGKTFSVIQFLITLAAVKKPGIRISIVSHSLPHIKRGAYRDFKLIMEQWSLWDDNQFSYSDFVYTLPNGSYIELFGLEDEGKARGPGRDILFVNEANLLSKTLYDQLAMRTTGQIFLDWNPADFVNWVYEVADNPKHKRIHSTYKNNLSNLSDNQISLIESYKQLPDDFLWKVYGLGQRGAAKELIYTNWKYYYDTPPNGDVFYGLDFGYTNPSAMVKITHYEGANYVEEILYQSSMTVPEMITVIKSMDIGRKVIYADAAEPKTIEEIYKAKINIKPSVKDVWAGIIGVKSYPLYIKKGSENLIGELQSYKWKKDKNDNVLEEPVKSNDHLCFSGDTMVNTANGLKRIDAISPSDRVLTSNGYQKVIKRFDNGMQYAVNYLMQFDMFSVSLRCTPNHLIKTNTGWTPISKLRSGQTIFLTKSTTAELTGYTQKKGILNATDGICTTMYGRPQTVKSLKATMCITRMKTHGTITYKTSNCETQTSTLASTCKAELKTNQNGLHHFSKKASRQHRNGIKARKVLNGINKKLHRKVLASSTLVPPIVNNAARNINVEPNMLSSAIQTARLKHLEQGGKLKIPVYDLEVENVHEYFANGVLVHNCDAMRYGIFTHLSTPKKQFTAAKY